MEVPVADATPQLAEEDLVEVNSSEETLCVDTEYVLDIPKEDTKPTIQP